VGSVFSAVTGSQKNCKTAYLLNVDAHISTIVFMLLKRMYILLNFKKINISI